MTQTKQMAVLKDLSEAIIGASKMEDVCQKIADTTAEILGVAKVSIMKFDPVEKVLKIVAAKGLDQKIVKDASVKIGSGISGHVFDSRKPVLINDIKTTKFQSRKGYKTRSLMSAPVTCFALKIGNSPIGVINVTDKKGKKGFTKDDLALLTTVANQTAAYLHICDLGEAARKGESLFREVEIARAIQERLLPRHFPVIDGLEVAGKCITAQQVGGDYFDFLVGGVRPPTIVIADVAGHNVGAAMMMSAFRSAVRSGNAVFSPSLMAERLNVALYNDLAGAEQFISMVYLQIMRSTKGMTAKYTTAGHYPPLILRGDSFISYGTEDVLLGVEKFADYHEKHVELEKGDLIFLYTDGLVEAMDSHGIMFGFERMKNLIKKLRDLPAKKFIEEMSEHVQKYAGKKGIKDDVTMVVVKVAK